MVAATTAAALALAGPAQAQAPVDPEDDPFYDAPPKRELAAAKRGEVLDSRVTTVSGLGAPLPNDAWQLVYRTNDARGRPEAAVTTVIRPAVPMPVGGKLPLVSYQTAEDSLGTQCAPSYTFRTGEDKEIPFVQAALNRG